MAIKGRDYEAISFFVGQANDPKQMEKAAMIIRACGHSTT